MAFARRRNTWRPNLGAVGRSAVQLASTHGAIAAGSCRPGSGPEARELGIDRIVDFDVEPAALTRCFDIVLDAAGTLPLKEARRMLTRGGRIVSVKPSPANMVRNALPGPFHVAIGKFVTADLKAVARAAGDGHLRLTIDYRIMWPMASQPLPTNCTKGEVHSAITCAVSSTLHRHRASRADRAQPEPSAPSPASVGRASRTPTPATSVRR